MSIDDRELEENEAKLDNILHKIVESSKQIQELKSNINVNEPSDYNEQLLDEIETLAEIIQNLAEAADDIDIVDEHATKKLEDSIETKLDKAIERIMVAKGLTQK